MTGKVAKLSNYDGGFAGGLTVRGMPLALAHPGKVFWVGFDQVAEDASSGTGMDALAFPNRQTASDGNKGTFLAPFKTIDYAVGQCTAGRGDIIMVLPGHSENLSTDGGIDLDVEGVAVIGLGTGTARPTIEYEAAAAAISVSAANCTISNIRCVASFADVTNAIDVTAAWLTVDGVEFSEEGADLNFVDYINASSTTDNTADGLTVVNCVGTAIDAAQNSMILTAADIDRLTVQNNMYSSDHANTLAMVEVATGKTVTDVLITDNVIYSGSTDLSATAGIANGDQTDNTGVVARNLVGHHDTAGEVLTDLDGVRQFENYGTATDTASGYLLPTADS